MKIIENSSRRVDTYETPGCLGIGYGISGLIVDDRLSRTGNHAIGTDGFYYEYIVNHCRVDLYLDRNDCGDEFVAHASEANVHAIKAIIVRVVVEHNNSDNDGGPEKTTLLDEELIIPLVDAFEESNGSVKDFLTRNGILAVMNKLRVLEVQATNKKKAFQLEYSRALSELENEHREKRSAAQEKAAPGWPADEMANLKASFDVLSRKLEVANTENCAAVNVAYENAVKAYLTTFNNQV